MSVRRYAALVFCLTLTAARAPAVWAQSFAAAARASNAGTAAWAGYASRLSSDPGLDSARASLGLRLEQPIVRGALAQALSQADGLTPEALSALPQSEQVQRVRQELEAQAEQMFLNPKTAEPGQLWRMSVLAPSFSKDTKGITRWAFDEYLKGHDARLIHKAIETAAALGALQAPGAVGGVKAADGTLAASSRLSPALPLPDFTPIPVPAPEAGKEDEVLFVCTGNTCRSPMAEAMLADLAKQDGVALKTASRGLSAHAGEPLTAPTQVILKERGLPADHLATQIRREDVERARVVLTMEGYHAESLRESFPDLAHKIHPLQDFAGNGPKDIRDPFITTFDLFYPGSFIGLTGEEHKATFGSPAALSIYRLAADEITDAVRKAWKRIKG